MKISNELIQQLVRSALTVKETPKDNSLYGSVVVYGDDTYVKIDGSQQLVPVVSTATLSDGDRITVRIQDHEAVVTGNITDPSASAGSLSAVSDSIQDTSNDILAQTAENITRALQDYVSSGNMASYQASVTASLQSLMAQTAANSNAINNANSAVTSLQNDFRSQVTETLNNIIKQNSDGSVSISTGNSEINLKFTAGSIVFRNGEDPIGYWDGTNFHTGNIVVEVQQRAQFGNFAFVPRSDGSLMFLKVGDET